MKKILIIDDLNDNLITFSAVIKDNLPNSRILTALSGKEGIKTAQEEQPDTILLDVNMPHMDGFEVCEQLKSNESTKPIPIILVTAIKADPSIRARGLNSGADAFLSKPIEENELMAQLSAMLRIKEAEDQLQLQLNERIKELNCLYGMAKVVETPGIVLERIVELTVSLLPPAWQYPEITCARIFLKNHEYNTANFLETKWKLSADIIVNEKISGEIIVCYLEERPKQDEGPFSIEERNLLNIMAKRLGIVAERKQMEKELIIAKEEAEESEGKLRIITDNLPIIISQVDKNLKYLFANKYYYNKSLIESGIVGKNVIDVIGEEAFNRAFPYMQKALSGEAVSFENRTTHTQNNELIIIETHYIPHIVNGQADSFFVLGMNITDRKESELASKLNEKRMDLLLQLNNMTDASMDDIYSFTLEKAVEITNSKIGFLGFVNDDSTKVSIYNWSGSAMKECSVENLSTDFDVSSAGIWGEVVRTGKPLIINNYNDPNPLKKGLPMGHVKLNNYLSIPIFKDDKIFAIVSVSNKNINYNKFDIKQLTLLLDGMLKFSQQRNDQENLKNALNKATESDRLKSAFLATMSHELRTPLNAVIGFSDIIDESVPIKDIVHYSNTINSSGKHLLKIVEDLFDITLIEAGEVNISLEKTNLNDFLQEVHQIISVEQQKLKKNHIKLNLSLREKNKDIFINTDPSKLKQIIINLLKNALKFTHSGHINYGFEIVTESKRQGIKFFVEDTGIGISEQKHEIIFEAFGQVEDTHTRTYGGSGIGLSLCKKLTEILGGEIWLDSEIDVGSTFYFTLPPSVIEDAENPEVPNEKEGEIEAVDFDRKTILVVEDDETSSDFLEIILEDLGVVTMKAQDGAEAIKYCQKESTIDLVLMDINMPVMDGYIATKAIKEFRPELPIIAQTAYAIAGDKEKVFEAGCDDYISKPINKDLLLEKMKKILIR